MCWFSYNIFESRRKCVHHLFLNFWVMLRWFFLRFSELKSEHIKKYLTVLWMTNFGKTTEQKKIQKTCHHEPLQFVGYIQISTNLWLWGGIHFDLWKRYMYETRQKIRMLIFFFWNSNLCKYKVELVKEKVFQCYHTFIKC
jgi:hypothetical protein